MELPFNLIRCLLIWCHAVQRANEMCEKVFEGASEEKYISYADVGSVGDRVEI